MLNSDDIAVELLAADFKPLSKPERTKAHGYQHAGMRYPVYLKMDGQAGAIKPSNSFPLVVHHEVHAYLIALTVLPQGISFHASPYKSTGLTEFRVSTQITPSGRAIAVANKEAMRALLPLLRADLDTAIDPYEQVHALAAADFVEALTVNAEMVTSAQRAMLIGHALAAGQRISMEGIALHGGYDTYNSANSQYGRLGAMLAEYFRIKGLANQTQMIAEGTEEHDTEGHFVWKMRPNMLTALRDLSWLPAEDSLVLAVVAAEHDLDAEEVERPPTVRQALVNARIGQGLYREQMLDLWHHCCSVTGCSVRSALIASHAKSWKDSADVERLDPHNGLLLTASIDKLFDRGLISFSEDGCLLRKPDLAETDLAHLGLKPDARLRSDHLKPRHLPYLAAHRVRHGFESDSPSM